MEEMDDSFWTIRAESLRFTFVVWECAARSVTLTCGGADTDKMFVIMNYKNSDEQTRFLKGYAWVSDSICHEKDSKKATKEEVLDFFTQMELNHKQLEASVVFDGSLAVEGDFDLHLRFDHPIQGKSLLVKKVAVGSNPLLVIDAFA